MKRLLLGARRPAPISARSCRKPGQHAVDVLLVVEEAGYLGAHLGHDLFVDAAGPLVDDEQSDIVLAHLPGDRAEDRLLGHLGIEELVRLLDGDHQGLGLGRVVGHRFSVRLLVLRVDTAGEHIGHEHISGDVAGSGRTPGRRSCPASRWSRMLLTASLGRLRHRRTAAARCGQAALQVSKVPSWMFAL